MKYLFIGSHCDEELCFAGTMAKLVQDGNEVNYLALSCCESTRLVDECTASCEILNVKVLIKDFPVRLFHEQRTQLADHLYRYTGYYETVVTHSINDRHPDHRTVAEESLRVFKCNLLTYMGPWNGDECSNYYVELYEEDIKRKLKAMACYESQAHRNYMQPEFIRAQAIYNGVKAGRKYAEAFKIHRMIG